MISEFQFKRNLYKNVSENLSEMDIWHIQLWILLGNEEVRERADGEGELSRRRNKKARDFTHFLNHKYTLLIT